MTTTPRRQLRLLATTSLMACSMAIAPVAIDFQLSKPVLKVAQADSSCFVAGAKVLMADGTDKPIEKIKIGDLVMGRSGSANRVIAVERPRLGSRLLYGFNGGPAFVTAEHPFMTLGGWKSIDPVETRRENGALTMGRLAPGDCLAIQVMARGPQVAGTLALQAQAGPTIVYEELTEIDAVPGDPDQLVYNLILEGDHSYFAEGYLVHNKGGDGGEGGEGGDSGSDGDGSDGDGSDGDGSGGEGSGGSSGGEGGSSGGSSGGESGEGGNSGSGSSGSGESGESGESSGSGESGESSESGESGESSESSESGEEGESSEAGDSGSAFGGVEQVGPDLSRDQEEGAIASGWQ